jgi:Flp pilus assembly protein TadB
MSEDRDRNGSGGHSLAALGIAALAIGCCVGLPVIVALAGSLAAGTLLGAGIVGIVVAVVLVAIVVLRARARRRACERDGRDEDHRGRRSPITWFG